MNENHDGCSDSADGKFNFSEAFTYLNVLIALVVNGKIKDKLQELRYDMFSPLRTIPRATRHQNGSSTPQLVELELKVASSGRPGAVVSHVSIRFRVKSPT